MAKNDYLELTKFYYKPQTIKRWEKSYRFKILRELPTNKYYQYAIMDSPYDRVYEFEFSHNAHSTEDGWLRSYTVTHRGTIFQRAADDRYYFRIFREGRCIQWSFRDLQEYIKDTYSLLDVKPFVTKL